MSPISTWSSPKRFSAGKEAVGLEGELVVDRTRVCLANARASSIFPSWNSLVAAIWRTRGSSGFAGDEGVLLGVGATRLRTDFSFRFAFFSFDGLVFPIL